MLGWGSLVLVIVIYGIVGVEKHRPSYLLPYIGTFVFFLVVSIVLTLILWVGSLALRDAIIDALAQRLAMNNPKHHAPSADEIGKVYNSMVTGLTFALLICIALNYYFFCVIYSYYKQMQEEDKGIFNAPGTGIVYAAPAVQTKGFSDCPPAYAPQPAVAPYPQQNVGYPQPAAGYPQFQQNAGYPQQQFPDYPQKQ